ncbi:hypothetical protein F4803DRAFT_467069 [Xylaria telfairii]|nr:hypothetical protein F4803DRAFT_467069 [Xylaria telfairii]
MEGQAVPTQLPLKCDTEQARSFCLPEMIPRQNSGEPDLEQGYVSKRIIVSPMADQNIHEVDYGQTVVEKPAKLQTIDEKTEADIPEAASTKSIPCSESPYRASIDSYDSNNAIPWVPKGTLIEKENSASSRAPGSIRCSIDSRGSLEGRLGSLNDGSQPLKRISAVQIRGPSRASTCIQLDNNTALAKGDPGTWAISHHKDNLVEEIKKTPTRNSILHCIWERGQDAKATEEWQRPSEENDLRVSFAELQRILQCVSGSCNASL